MEIRWMYILIIFITTTQAFWDLATTTVTYENTDNNPRQSFFRWQMIQWEYLRFWIPQWDWIDITHRRHLNCVAGISIEMIPLGVAALLNRRCLITSANYLEPYQHRQKEVRIWALGRAGRHLTPFRYRVWRIRRVVPKTNNPEHFHGPRGVHIPRHDVSIIHSWDQIYLYHIYPSRYHYPVKVMLALPKTHIEETWFAGSGYEYILHIRENYKIFYSIQQREDIVNCEKYLPKWWGKFICIINVRNHSGVPNGGPLTTNWVLVGMGCFEIRYNEDRIMVFTDLRYYYNMINVYANNTPQEYYEYAYPQWSVKLGWLYDGHQNYPYNPFWQRKNDLWPLGK